MSKEFGRRDFLTGQWGQEEKMVAGGGILGFLSGETGLDPDEVKNRLNRLEARQDSQGYIINHNADILQWVIEQITTDPGHYKEPNRDTGTAEYE